MRASLLEAARLDSGGGAQGATGGREQVSALEGSKRRKLASGREDKKVRVEYFYRGLITQGRQDARTPGAVCSFPRAKF